MACIIAVQLKKLRGLRRLRFYGFYKVTSDGLSCRHGIMYILRDQKDAQIVSGISDIYLLSAI